LADEEDARDVEATALAMRLVLALAGWDSILSSVGDVTFVVQQSQKPKLTRSRGSGITKLRTPSVSSIAVYIIAWFQDGHDIEAQPHITKIHAPWLLDATMNDSGGCGDRCLDRGGTSRLMGQHSVS
jgi:hypothetical protein